MHWQVWMKLVRQDRNGLSSRKRLPWILESEPVLLYARITITQTIVQTLLNMYSTCWATLPLYSSCICVVHTYECFVPHCIWTGIFCPLRSPRYAYHRKRYFRGFKFSWIENLALQGKILDINFLGSKIGGVGCGITNSTYKALPTMANHYYEFAIASPCRRELNNRHDPFAVAVPGYQITMGVISNGKNSMGK